MYPVGAAMGRCSLRGTVRNKRLSKKSCGDALGTSTLTICWAYIFQKQRVFIYAHVATSILHRQQADKYLQWSTMIKKSNIDRAG